MISLAILIRAYLVIGLIIGAGAHASLRASNRMPKTTDWGALYVVFAASVLWLPYVLGRSVFAIWKEIRHG